MSLRITSRRAFSTLKAFSSQHNASSGTYLKPYAALLRISSSTFPTVSQLQLSRHSFSTSPYHQSLIPDAEDPPPPSTEPTYHIRDATPISPERFLEVSEEYFERLLSRIEALQESREDVDVEYSVSHLPFPIPTIHHEINYKYTP